MELLLKKFEPVDTLLGLRKKWVLPSTFVKHGHCAPWSASSYEILNLIDTLHLTLLGAEFPEATQRKGLRGVRWDLY